MGYLRPKTIGNFKPSMEERFEVKRKSPRERREKRAGNDSSHLACIRELPCIACLMETPARLKTECDPHHLKCGPARDERGMGQRATDQWAVPLCRVHHEQVERSGSGRELSWWQIIGFPKPWDLARALWIATGERRRMGAIVFAQVRQAHDDQNSAPSGRA